MAGSLNVKFPIISAHKAGYMESGSMEGSAQALTYGLSTDAEYIEFDVQRFSDGSFFIAHDKDFNLDGVLTSCDTVPRSWADDNGVDIISLEDIVDKIAESGKKAHVDLKFLSPEELPDIDSWEIAAAEIILSKLPPENVIITSLEDDSIRRLSTYYRDTHPKMLIGLSLGRDSSDLNIVNMIKLRWSELFPGRRIKACGATLVAANYQLARITVAPWCKRNKVPLMVWTVDHLIDMQYWVGGNNAWMVTTNLPSHALRIRESRLSLL